ncbi:uncharacterized protein LODBEIA_P45060 [Lodderomyces beijingensis]|uniref:DUF1279 domain-containing protein n=1 Tax=Lodderomyces beijingensis TaxID=1775926 RepID=A0ABP0ZSF2_9ASCO
MDVPPSPTSYFHVHPPGESMFRFTASSSRMYMFNPTRRLTSLNPSSCHVRPWRNIRFQSTTSSSTAPKPRPKGIKALMKEYGYPALAVYIALSCIDLPLCYILVHSMGKEQIEIYENKVKQAFGYGVSDEELAKRHEIQEIEARIDAENEPQWKKSENGDASGSSWLQFIKDQFSWTEFALAYGIHKSLIFIRLPITAAITPGIVGVLRRWGFKIGTDKLSTTAKLAKEMALNKSKMGDFTASSERFGVRPGKKKWWWFF